MKTSKFNLSQMAAEKSNSKLSRYLEQLAIGRKGTPRSWLYEDFDDANQILQLWLKQLETLKTGSSEMKLIYDFDVKQVEKFGQQGIVPPVDEAIQVESFQEQYVEYDGSVSEKRSLTDILHLRKHSLHYKPFLKVIQDMDSRDTLLTNSGWPLYTRRKEVVNESIRDAKTGKAWNYPAIILFRHYNGKLRVVWMYPMSMNLLEYQATQPLQDIIRKTTKYVTPWLGFDHVKRRFTELWHKHPYAFGGDTTAMDAHMQIKQNEVVAAACSDLFSDPQQMIDSLLHVNSIDIVVGHNEIIKDQFHGVASGSGWTQLCETIFQILKFDEYIRENKLHITIDDGMGIGDDYVWFFDTQQESEKIVDFWERDGLPGKPEKQSNFKDNCTFLQRLFIKGYMSRDDKAVLGGIYPTVRALNSLVWPERFHSPKDWNSDMFCVRCYTILENTVDHPLFEEFVKFVIKGQKDLLPFAKQKASDINAAQQKSRLIPGLNPSYNQEKMEKPLSEFSSIKYAATL